MGKTRLAAALRAEGLSTSLPLDVKCSYAAAPKDAVASRLSSPPRTIQARNPF